MARHRLLTELGQGTSLRRQDYTQAALRAVENALWRNSINMAELFGFEKSAMLLDVEIAVAAPEKVDVATVAKVFPYGQPRITVTKGGLDVPRPGGEGRTIIAQAAISVAFDMEPA